MSRRLLALYLALLALPFAAHAQDASAGCRSRQALPARQVHRPVERRQDPRRPPPESGRTGVVAFGPTVTHYIHSISKSVISLVIGIAGGEGKFPDLDAPATDHVPARYADLRSRTLPRPGLGQFGCGKLSG
jgi:hypothetical protein